MHIAFFPQRELHLPILIPLYESLTEAGHSCFIVLKPLQPEYNNVPAEGIHSETQSLLEAQFNCLQFALNLKFDLTFTADFVLDYTEDWGKQCCVGHGTISKNTYFIEDEIAWRENFHEYLVLPGPAYKASFRNKLFNEVLTLGFPKLDYLNSILNQKTELKTTFRNQYGISDQRKILLFAPTYNDEFESYSVLYSFWDEVIENGYFIIFKLHGATKIKWLHHYEVLAQNKDHCLYWTSQDIAKPMVISDIMVSDLSSVCLEYYLTQQPLFVYNNPKQTTSKFYNAKGVEFKYRDGAYPFNSALQLMKQLNSQVEEDPKAILRFKYSQLLFPPRQHSSVKSITDFFSNKPPSLPRAHSMSHPIVVSLSHKVSVSQLEHLFDQAYFPVSLLEKDRKLYHELMSKRSPPFSVEWIGEGHSLPTMHYHGDGFLPRNWDLKWQVSQQLAPHHGKIGFINKDNIMQILHVKLTMSEVARQKYLSYKGFSRFFEGEILSQSFIETEPNLSTAYNWAGLYLAEAI